MITAQEILANGGGTWSPDTKTPKSGFMVSLFGAEQKIPMGEFNDIELSRYAYEHKLNPGEFIGAWVSDGFVYLDISVNIRDESLAMGTAISNRQLAYWDVERECEIPVSVQAVKV
jgi:hypothetical protein